MPGEYGNKRSISVYIEKEIVEQIEQLAYEADMQRSTFVANLIRNCLDKRWKDMNFCDKCGKKIPFNKYICEECRKKQMGKHKMETWGAQWVV